jgi:hypothetical protein
MGLSWNYDLHQRMRDLGAEDPSGWADSELTEDIAQEARWLVIRQIRAGIDLLVENPRSIAEVAMLLDSGADETLVRAAVKAISREVAFSTSAVIDEGCDPDAPEDAPGWLLMETRGDQSGEPR